MIDILKTKRFDIHDAIASSCFVPPQTRCIAKILSSPGKLRNKLFSCEYLLTKILHHFQIGIIMLALIMRKRKAMAPKEALIEEAALNSVGMQQTHVLGIVGVLFFVTVLFGLAGVKSITWFLLLTTNLVFFAYLMKLTVTSGIGPDGMPLEDEDSSDDDSDEEDEGYKAPEMTEEKADAEQGGIKNLPPIM